MNRKRIAVIAGGDSPEVVISRKSASQVFESIDRTLFEPYLITIIGTLWETVDGIPIDKNDFSFVNKKGDKIKFDYALIMIHGTPGENGILQGYFELLRIPYSTCSAEVSAITFNKTVCKKTISDVSGVNLAKEITIRRGDKLTPELYAQELKLPFFIKPNASGSSFGVTKVASVDQISPAIEKAFEEGEVVLMEEFIQGIEVSQGVMIIGEKEFLLPATELDSSNDFFDFEAKYTTGVTNEITPARIPETTAILLNKTSMEIYKTLGCKGIVRIDYIIMNNKPYFIEVNTVPGMSANSIVPQQWAYLGYTMQEAFTMIITNEPIVK